MDALQKYLQRREESKPSPSSETKQSLFRNLRDGLYSALRPPIVEQTPQKTAILDESTSEFYSALERAKRKPDLFHRTLDAVGIHSFIDGSIDSLETAARLATELQYDRNFHGITRIGDDLAKRVLRNVPHNVRNRYSFWYETTTEMTDRANRLAKIHATSVDVNDFYRMITDGLTAELSYRVVNKPSFWFEDALERPIE